MVFLELHENKINAPENKYMTYMVTETMNFVHVQLYLSWLYNVLHAESQSQFEGTLTT